MTATILSITPPRTSTCIGCGKTFIPPALANHREGDKTTCRSCVESAKAARMRAGIDAYTAMCTTGMIRK